MNYLQKKIKLFKSNDKEQKADILNDLSWHHTCKLFFYIHTSTHGVIMSFVWFGWNFNSVTIHLHSVHVQKVRVFFACLDYVWLWSSHMPCYAVYIFGCSFHPAENCSHAIEKLLRLEEFCVNKTKTPFPSCKPPCDVCFLRNWNLSFHSTTRLITPIFLGFSSQFSVKRLGLWVFSRFPIALPSDLLLWQSGCSLISLQKLLDNRIWKLHTYIYILPFSYAKH